MVIGTFLTIGRKKYKLFLILISIFILLIGIVIFPIFGEFPQLILSKVLPNQIWLEFSDLEISRLDIWKKAFGYIFKNPIFGSGAGSFTALYEIDSSIWKGHAHNLIIELITSYFTWRITNIWQYIYHASKCNKKVFLTFTYTQTNI